MPGLYWLILIATVIVVCYIYRETLILKGWSWYNRYRQFCRSRAIQHHGLATVEIGRLGLKIQGFTATGSQTSIQAMIPGVEVDTSTTWNRLEVGYHRSTHLASTGVYYGTIIQGKYYGPTPQSVHELGYLYVRVRSLLNDESTPIIPFRASESIVELLDRVWYSTTKEDTSDLLDYQD